MTILVIADDDSQICGLRVDQVDLLISCGDMPEAAILRAMDFYRPKQVFAVKGNHDSAAAFPPGVTDLHLEMRKAEGLSFGGFEGAWRYKPVGHHLFDQKEVSAMMRYFPSVDILITHNSPAGVHERDREVHQGFEGFKDYINRANPGLMIHGHQHHEQITVMGRTTIAGVYGERLFRID
jgi:Icc-related predicted phosphoesterase